ncbi:MAG TPA: hypothetical protein DEQ40_19110 [Oxalobacteraceae bacterium]|nr:hypothetical protein [Oxalobacteraceae bacterium]
MRDRYHAARSADAHDREPAELDTRFVGGDQWNPEEREARRKAKRPCLTENRLPVFVASVANDGRQNNPSILVTPMDGGTKDTAEFFAGRIRHIEYESDADIAYDQSRDQQVTSGRGSYRVSTEYLSGDSGPQRICIAPIANQFNVTFDPAAKRYDRSDAEYVFVSELMSKDAFKRRFGKDTEAATQSFFEGGNNPAPEWIGTGKDGAAVMVAEYWHKVYGASGECKVVQDIVNGVEILETTEWIGSTIPIIPVWGKELVVDGRRCTYSLVRNAIDPQRLINLYVSNIAEQIAQMPKAPYIAPEGAISGREDEWADANNTGRAVLQWKAVLGLGVGSRPERVVNEPPIQALVIGYNQAVDSLKAAMGIYDSSLGAKSNETSGIAIQKRQRESDVSNFHFSDNEARSRKYLGKILMELIPIVDAGKDTLPVRGVDGKVRLVPVGQPYRDEKTGKVQAHYMDQGEYDVAISSGPSYTSQREAENQRDAQLIQAQPDLMMILGDMFFYSEDSPGSQERGDRMKKFIAMKNPGLIESPGQPQLPPEVMQQMQQGQQLLQEQHQIIQKLQQALETKQIEAAAKFKEALLHADTAIRVAEIGAGVKTGIAAADRDASTIETMLGMAHDTGMAAMNHAHAGAAADQQAQQQSEAQSADQSHQAEMQQASQQQPDQPEPQS